MSEDSPDAPIVASPQAAVAMLQDIGRRFYGKGWSVATSSNYSVVVGREPLRLLITASGKDKERLTPEDFVIVDEQAQPIAPGPGKPSAETWLHAVLARRPSVGAVLHTHSVWGTLVSNRFAGQGGVTIQGYEMQKGLSGITTHEHPVRIAIFENTQDIPALARQLDERLQRRPSDGLEHAFLIRRHGLYTWGRTVEEARRHVEALEFLFEVIVRQDERR